MQINFYTSPDDEQELVDYIYKRDGYFIVYESAKADVYPILDNGALPPSRSSGTGAEHVISKFRSLNISNERIARIPRNNENGQAPAFRRDQLLGERGFRFEMIDFIRSYSDGERLYPGRLWLNGLEDETIRFYRSICSYLRKSSERNEAGWWVGKTVGDFCLDHDLEKSGFAFPTYSLQAREE